MATRFFIKRSVNLDNPGTILAAGELAYSYRTNKLFIGNSAGEGYPAVEITDQNSTFEPERFYFQQFTQADLELGNILVVNHGLGIYPNSIALWNNYKEAFYPDSITTTEDLDTLYIDLSSFVPLIGSYYITISEQGEMKFGLMEILSAVRLFVAPGGNYAGLKAPAAIATSYTLRLPSGLPVSNQGLKVDPTGNLDYFDLATVQTYRTSFTDVNLTLGILAITHNLNQKIVNIQISDNNNKLIIPDEVTLTSNTQASLDLSSYGTITGTWNLLALG